MVDTFQISATPQPPTPARHGCPVCGGVLIPQRGQVRCQRCQWTMCAGCEPVHEPAEEESAINSR
jgi:hypothetical protein